MFQSTWSKYENVILTNERKPICTLKTIIWSCVTIHEEGFQSNDKMDCNLPCNLATTNTLKKTIYLEMVILLLEMTAILQK